MTRLLVSLSVLVGLQAVASAQTSPNDITIGSFDPEDAVAPTTSIEGRGVSIGEGTVLRPVFGVETGVVSNVFYTATDPQSAGLLRLLAQVGVGSYSGERMMPADDSSAGSPTVGSFAYRASLAASYDVMLSGDQTVSSTGGLGLDALFRGAVNPGGKLTLTVDEDYTRLIRAANFETDADTDRDVNVAGLTLLYHPPGSSLSGYLYYQNTIDVFERSEQQFADRFENKLGIHPMWRWLPQTVVFADVSEGIFTGLGVASTKVTSFPLTAVAGIATLLTPSITANLQAGYTNGFYSSGPSYSGPAISAQLGYRYSALGRVMASYDLLYSDSINANFYRDNVVRVWWQHLVHPFVIMAQPELHFREYDGVIVASVPPSATRDDVIFAVIAGVHYNFRNSLEATLDYRFTDLSSNFRYMSGTDLVDPSYVRHELLLGIRYAP